MTARNARFFSCDWGTTSLRVRLVSNGIVSEEARSANGIRAIYDRARHSVNREQVYADALAAVLGKWLHLASPLPLVISGMASSSIGWKELPYSRAPVALDGSTLRSERLIWSAPACVAETWLISGAATKTDIMRGEETEAIGLLAAWGKMRERGLLVLPGTHSKHLVIEDGAIQDFSTSMTGELFEVLSHHSVLKATVDPAGMADERPEHLAAFREGVASSRAQDLGRSIFRARTRGVLEARTGASNAWFLSGVLIGAELADLFSCSESMPVWLGGAGPLRSLYRLAAETLAGDAAWEEAPLGCIENAVPRAHALFLENHA